MLFASALLVNCPCFLYFERFCDYAAYSMEGNFCVFDYDTASDVMLEIGFILSTFGYSIF